MLLGRYAPLADLYLNLSENVFRPTTMKGLRFAPVNPKPILLEDSLYFRIR